VSGFVCNFHFQGGLNCQERHLAQRTCFCPVLLLGNNAAPSTSGLKKQSATVNVLLIAIVLGGRCSNRRPPKPTGSKSRGIRRIRTGEGNRHGGERRTGRGKRQTSREPGRSSSREIGRRSSGGPERKSNDKEPILSEVDAAEGKRLWVSSPHSCKSPLSGVGDGKQNKPIGNLEYAEIQCHFSRWAVLASSQRLGT
jgi:hypothetical protein